MAFGITIIGIARHWVLLSHYTIFLFLVLHGIGYYYQGSSSEGGRTPGLFLQAAAVKEEKAAG